MRLIDADALYNKYQEAMAHLLSSTNIENISAEAISLLCGSTLIRESPIIIETHLLEIVHCKDCKWRGKVLSDGSIEWSDKELFKCPGQVDDHYYDWIPDDDFYCANGEK